MASEDEFATELTQLSDRAERGTDAVEFMLGFFEKLSKIEQSYSKALEELTSSRTGKLQRLFGNESVEHVAEVESLWRVLVEDVKTVADVHREIGERMHSSACVPLNEMKTANLPSQAQHLQQAKKLVLDIKAKRANVAQMEKKYHKVCREFAVEMKELDNPRTTTTTTTTTTTATASTTSGEQSPSEEQQKQPEDASHNVLLRAFKQNKECEGNLLKSGLEAFNDARTTAFTTDIHRHLKAAQHCEVVRIETIKKSVASYVDIMHAEHEKVKFAKTTIELSRVHPNELGVYKVITDVPTAIEFVEPSNADLFPNGDVPTKKKDEGLFASIFKPSTSKSSKTERSNAVPAAPPATPITSAITTEINPQPLPPGAPSAGATSSAPGGFFSFFKKAASKPGTTTTTTTTTTATQPSTETSATEKASETTTETSIASPEPTTTTTTETEEPKAEEATPATTTTHKSESAAAEPSMESIVLVKEEDAKQEEDDEEEEEKKDATETSS